MTHHEYETSFIGDSDIAGLIIQAYDDEKGIVLQWLAFGWDATYHAYIVDAKCSIPCYYEPRFSAKGPGWIRIYDDHSKTFDRGFSGSVTIYRSGDFGCIIQLI